MKNSQRTTDNGQQFFISIFILYLIIDAVDLKGREIKIKPPTRKPREIKLFDLEEE